MSAPNTPRLLWRSAERLCLSEPTGPRTAPPGTARAGHCRGSKDAAFKLRLHPFSTQTGFLKDTEQVTAKVPYQALSVAWSSPPHGLCSPTARTVPQKLRICSHLLTHTSSLQTCRHLTRCFLWHRSSPQTTDCHWRGWVCRWSRCEESTLCTLDLLCPIYFTHPKLLLCEELAFVFKEGFFFFYQLSELFFRCKISFPQRTILRCSTEQRSVTGDEMLVTKYFWDSLKTE